MAFTSPMSSRRFEHPEVSPFAATQVRSGAHFHPSAAGRKRFVMVSKLPVKFLQITARAEEARWSLKWPIRASGKHLAPARVSVSKTSADD